MRRRQLLGITAGACLACGGVWLLLPRPPRTDLASVRRRAEALGARHGIAIGYGPPETFYAAPYSQRYAHIVGGSATAVDPRVLPQALDGIEQSLSIYPAGFFAGLCKAIFVCGSLTLDGAEAGGTYGPAWIILVATEKTGSIYETARLGVHHEFSSLVWNRLTDLQARWKKHLPAGWRPSPNNALALQAADSPRPATDGFLSAYGATTEENDFNVYAQIALTEPRRIHEAARNEPRVAAKMALLIQAYTFLDARMLQVFEQLGLASFRDPRATPLTNEITVSPLGAPVGTVVP